MDSTPLNKESFASWAVVQQMGHVTYAGYVTEERIAGADMLRIDVPALEDTPAFTKYIGGSTLYDLTPTSEQFARLAARRISALPISTSMVPEALQTQLQLTMSQPERPGPESYAKVADPNDAEQAAILAEMEAEEDDYSFEEEDDLNDDGYDEDGGEIRRIEPLEFTSGHGENADEDTAGLPAVQEE